uniref:Uncharacterized protein n=1 Tax=Caenorhabditis tropicalis TaxID=1561998 RepID=A0A1I7UUZ5_9PELO
MPTTSIDVNEVEPSRDQKPVVVTKDETTPAATSTPPTTAMSNDVTEETPVQSAVSYGLLLATVIPLALL